VILATAASTGHSSMGSAVEWPVPGTGGGRTAMPQRIRQSVVVFLPIAFFLVTELARRWG
jgi:hypothetical protein